MLNVDEKSAGLEQIEYLCVQFPFARVWLVMNGIRRHDHIKRRLGVDGADPPFVPKILVHKAQLSRVLAQLRSGGVQHWLRKIYEYSGGLRITREQRLSQDAAAAAQ